MTSTHFQFTMTIPCDARLAETLRDLTMHAARYAELTGATATTVAEQVQAAAASTIGTAGGVQHALELHITRHADVLECRISCDMQGQAALPASTSPCPGLTIEWRSEGPQRSCVIVQRTR